MHSWPVDQAETLAYDRHILRRFAPDLGAFLREKRPMLPRIGVATESASPPAAFAA
jgi:hypothetical protein